jgi:hypothetical protein
MEKTCKPTDMYHGGKILDTSAAADSCDGNQSQDQLQMHYEQMQKRLRQIDAERQGGAATSRGPTVSYNRGSTTPRDAAPAATARAYAGGDGEGAQDPLRKGNMNDMRAKLQSIQTGKAYLEKKIQEYESRLNQMKVKKDRHGKQQRMKNM